MNGSNSIVPDISQSTPTEYINIGSRTFPGNTKDVSLRRKILSACVGSVITSLVVTPLDVVKVRLQVGNYGSLEYPLNSTYCDQHPKNGNGLSIYSKCLGLRKDQFGRLHCDQLIYSSKLFDHVEPLTIQRSPNPTALSFEFNRPLVINAPRISLSLAQMVDKSSVLSGLRQIFQQDGLLGLWRGLTPTLIMAVPATVVYFVGYESLRNHPLWHNESHNAMIKNSAPMICGASARALAVCAISPLELLRTRIQSINGTSGSNITILRDMKTMIKKNGIMSLWKGLIPTLWRDVPFSAIYWLVYERTKDHLGSRLPDSNAVLITFLSGSISGMLAALITTPLDVAKTRRQVQGVEADGTSVSSSKGSVFSSQERSMRKILLAVWDEAGWRGLFRGLGARIVKVAPACGIMIASYEFGKGFWSDG